MMRQTVILTIALALAGAGGRQTAPARSFDTVVALETTSEDSANVSMGDLGQA